MSAMPDANARAMNALRRLVSALRTAGADANVEHAMSVAQCFALRVIGGRPGLTMSELAQQTLTTRSTISEIVVKLVNKGLVCRRVDPSDQRRIRLQLTAAGVVAFGSMGETLPERLVRALDSMTPAMRESLAALLEQWIESAGLSREPPAMFDERRESGVRLSPDGPDHVMLSRVLSG
jgi:DNA-binding MarR family transcriptional regulator